MSWPEAVVPRFFFDFRDAERAVSDPDGVDLADLPAARLEGRRRFDDTLEASRGELTLVVRDAWRRSVLILHADHLDAPAGGGGAGMPPSLDQDGSPVLGTEVQ